MKKLTPYILLIPQMIIGAVFLAGLGTGIVQSLGVIPAFGMTKFTTQYYREVLQDPNLIAAVKYSLFTSFLSAFIACAGGTLICALLVSRKKTAGPVMRIVQLPIIVPHLVVALFIVNIFSQNGILARIGAALGLLRDQSEFPLLIYDPHGFGVILAYVWKELPFVIYFVMALMANINGKLGEAAVNLGASRRTAFLRVTLPLCMKSILTAFLIIYVFSLGAYEMPFILGATKPKALPVLAYVAFQNPDLRTRPRAMAVNGIIIFLSLLALLVYHLLIMGLRRKGERA